MSEIGKYTKAKLKYCNSKVFSLNTKVQLRKIKKRDISLVCHLSRLRALSGWPPYQPGPFGLVYADFSNSSYLSYFRLYLFAAVFPQSLSTNPRCFRDQFRFGN